MTAKNKFRDFNCPFSEGKKEQAEAGRSPALLALRFATGVLRILQGYLALFLTVKQKKKEYFVVFAITGYHQNKITIEHGRH